MTHFVGLVVAETEAEIAAILQPFHEYECTWLEDQYVVDVDMTAEAREVFAAETTNCLRDDAGVLHRFFTPEGQWDTRFSQPDPNPDARARDRRVKYVPPGYAEATVPTSELEDFGKWAVAYYGAEQRGEGENVQIIQRTNPNAQWDWWQIGGRWDDMVPGNSCLIEDVPKYFTDWKPSVLVDADGWHADKEWGWFGSSSPSETPEAVDTKLAQHAGKRAWVVDFHI